VRDFGPEERKVLLAGVGTAFDFVAREGFGVGRTRRSWPPPLLVLCCAGFAGFLGLRAWRRLPRRNGGNRKDRSGADSRRVVQATFYEEAVSHVARRGVVRKSSQSPREYVVRATPVLGEDSGVFGEITGAFERVRYGFAEISPEELGRLTALAERLRPENVADRK